MSRPLRIEYENAVYHVMNRGRGRQLIFHGPTYYAAFQQCLLEAHQRFGVEVLAYCFMGNHYHLLLKTPRGNISRVMRHINGLYTQRYNRLKHTDGALFRGRYKSIVVDERSYLLEVSRYIHRNPIETKKPLVNKLELYPWSSYPAFINKASTPSWLKRDAIYDELGSIKRYSGYQRFVELGIDEATTVFYAKKHTPAIWGDKQFVKTASKQSKNWSKEITQSGSVESITIKSIIQHVAHYFTITEQSIVTAQRGPGSRNVPRWIAMKLCQDYSEQKLAVIAKAFGVGNYCTVSQTISRLVALLEKDKLVASQLSTLSRDLTP